MLRLDLKSKNNWEGKPFIKIHTNIWVDRTCNTWILSMATRTLTKCKYISTCFVRWCFTGLDAK